MNDSKICAKFNKKSLIFQKITKIMKKHQIYIIEGVFFSQKKHQIIPKTKKYT